MTLTLGYFRSGTFHFNFTLNGTYIARFAEARSANLPLVNEVSTQNHPINLKMRGSMGWMFKDIELSGSLNYYNQRRANRRRTDDPAQSRFARADPPETVPRE